MPLCAAGRAASGLLAAVATSALLSGAAATDGQPSELAEFAEGDVALLDDECSAEDGEGCAFSALQMKRAKTAGESEHESLSESALLELSEEELESHRDLEAENSTGVWHYALPCWNGCHGQAGYCQNYCGPGNACCRYMNSADPTECHGIRFWPVLTFYTCVSTGIVPDANKVDAGSTPALPGELIYASVPSLMEPSSAPTFTFYMYRVQTAQNYDPENQDMANIGGALWYLHNEIVWHPHMQRSGTYFSSQKTRIERFKVSTKATAPLFAMGMNFGPVNAFDLTKCTGPYNCENFAKVGYAVGCEDWTGGAASFPHQQWVGKNKYPGAKWWSLPGPCSSMGMGKKTQSCMLSEPGGACRSSKEPTGRGDCTYTYEKVGEISIDELEGIRFPTFFKAMGYSEYDQGTDKGRGTSFWDKKMDEAANKARMDHALELFKKKYPDQPDLEDPPCDFNKHTFYASMGRRV